MGLMAVQIVGEQRLDSLAVQMLDADVPPIRLPAVVANNTHDVAAMAREMLDQLLAYLLQCDSDQIAEVMASIPDAYHMFLDRESARGGEKEAIRKVATYWLVDAINDRLRIGSLSPCSPFRGGRVWERFPLLRSFTTDEGLLRLDRYHDLMKDGVLVDGHIVRFHPWLGPCRTESPDFDLLAMLCDHARTTANVVAIALDGRCYTRLDQYLSSEYKDYWYGPPYSRADLNDRTSARTTVYRAPLFETAPEVAGQCLLSGIRRTEFYWKYETERNIKKFEAEEVVDPSRNSTPRYLHAEYDMATETFSHMDGAVMIYSTHDSKFRQSESCVLPRTPRANPKPKLFRIDGSISVEQWSKVLCLFFRGNPLVHEYVSGSTSPSVDLTTSS